jgi:hypothetical protein
VAATLAAVRSRMDQPSAPVIAAGTVVAVGEESLTSVPGIGRLRRCWHCRTPSSLASPAAGADPTRRREWRLRLPLAATTVGAVACMQFAPPISSWATRSVVDLACSDNSQSDSKAAGAAVEWIIDRGRVELRCVWVPMLAATHSVAFCGRVRSQSGWTGHGPVR